MSEKPKTMDHLFLREIDGELAIYDSKNGKLHFINPTGAAIFELCDSAHTVADIVREISTIFSKTPVDAESDVRQFLSLLAEKELTIE